ncbi:hypothetical protein O3P69_000334 [Scylla paramamosain]|uniref:Uncharacterized protein n=1 Tax=Scylla paramamosain TaxID=85552 RepID=A0AAW0UVN4_SCYPA
MLFTATGCFGRPRQPIAIPPATSCPASTLPPSPRPASHTTVAAKSSGGRLEEETGERPWLILLLLVLLLLPAATQHSITHSAHPATPSRSPPTHHRHGGRYSNSDGVYWVLQQCGVSGVPRQR